MAMVTARQSSFELLRIVSAAGIVWFHASVTGSEIGYTGLTVFLLLTALFELGVNFERRTPWTRHATRLLVPFVFWSAIYTAANVVKGKPVLNLEGGPVLGVLAGPSIHLWYLPFMAAVLAVLGLLKVRVSQRTIGALAFMAVVPIIGAFHYLRPEVAQAPPPVPQWFHATVPVLLGAVVGANRNGTALLRGLTVGTLALAFAVSGDVQVLEFLAGVLLVELAARVSWSDARVNRVAGMMMGVYLVHPLALTMFRIVEPYSQAAFVAGAFIASTAGVMMAARLAPKVSGMLLGTPKAEPRRVKERPELSVSPS
ncbi:acyltransferase family protein [Novosphingobium jiangmenense]|uniref:Acyltransferase 3 domain-containing protein n=1 Tax=Novosphingobium jiangmenense TaxID=2791981 RepID=A0ABS0HLC1_9SPHN|nr:acyltransferase family protein [Novosphingobium jiangmenense]MBF9153047.1 hypothetical protein [Novosphingobium jiangmenense]